MKGHITFIKSKLISQRFTGISFIMQICSQILSIPYQLFPFSCICINNTKLKERTNHFNRHNRKLLSTKCAEKLNPEFN